MTVVAFTETCMICVNAIESVVLMLVLVLLLLLLLLLLLGLVLAYRRLTLLLVATAQQRTPAATHATAKFTIMYTIICLRLQSKCYEQ